MAQGRQQNNGSRQRCAQSAAAKAPAEPPKAVCAQLEQMNRKLAAASAEILRYQTRLFACERQMAALRQENAQLEAACEQARQEAECASAHAEQLRQELARHAEAVRPVPVAAHTPPQPEPSAAQSPRPEPEAEQPPQPGPYCRATARPEPPCLDFDIDTALPFKQSRKYFRQRQRTGVLLYLDTSPLQAVIGQNLP